MECTGKGHGWLLHALSHHLVSNCTLLSIHGWLSAHSSWTLSASKHLRWHTIVVNVWPVFLTCSTPPSTWCRYCNCPTSLAPVVQHNKGLDCKIIQGEGAAQWAPQHAPASNKESKSALNIHLDTALEEIEVFFGLCVSMSLVGH